MENPGTTSTKNETQTSCLIYLSPDIDSSSFVDFNHKLTSKKYLADLQVASVNNQFEVRSKISNFDNLAICFTSSMVIFFFIVFDALTYVKFN